MSEERLQKILARGGVASRRAAEEMIKAGRVRVNGKTVSELGAKANTRRDKIELDGKLILRESFVYAVLQKPRGYMSTLSDPEGRPTVKELLHKLDGRVFPVGRLDFATSGVLLITNDGDFANGLTHPRHKVPKTYVVKVQGEMSEKDMERWRRGIELEDGKTQPAELTFDRYEDKKTWFELTISEGRNQQIRRMGEATGFPVMRLSRLSFAGITGEKLKPGAVRHLTYKELTDLKKAFGVPKRLAPSGLDIEDAKALKKGRLTLRSNKDNPNAGIDSRDPNRFAPKGREGAPKTRGDAAVGRPERGQGSSAPREESAKRQARGSSRPESAAVRGERVPHGARRDDTKRQRPKAEGPARQRPVYRGGPKQDGDATIRSERSSKAGKPAAGARERQSRSETPAPRGRAGGAAREERKERAEGRPRGNGRSHGARAGGKSGADRGRASGKSDAKRRTDAAKKHRR